MKKKLLLFITCIQFIGFAQQKTFEIVWQGSTIFETTNSKIEIPAFNKNNFEYNTSKGLTFFTEWNASSTINENSVVLSNVNYVSMSNADLKDLAVGTLPKTPRVKLVNTKARQKKTVYLEISPIINDNGSIKKITSFTVTYNFLSTANRTQNQSLVIENSVLNSGDWYRFHVDKTGVFQINRSFLEQLGVNTGNTDPRTIKIYGSGGKMLPLENSAEHTIDPTENAISFIGEEDGIINNEDYILFYAEGPTNYSEESNTNINAYTDKTYYYLNVSGGFGKRISQMNQPTGNANITINTFEDYQFYEVDEFNIVKLGRRWFGDRFDIETQKSYDFTFPNLTPNTMARVKVYAASASETSTSMKVKLNDVEIDDFLFPEINDPVLASGDSLNQNTILPSSEITIDLEYNNSGNPSSVGYLDYISIEATRDLTFESTQLIFKNSAVANTSGIAEYTISNAAAVDEVWDVTDRFNVTKVTNTNQDAIFNFKTFSGSLKTYLAITPTDYFQPLIDGNVNVANQNLKGTIFQNNQGQFQDIDYIIVTPTFLISQAERLAQINRDQYNLNVKVVTLDNIYAEFNTGNPDIAAIRNFVKYVYDNASLEANKLKYLCLFGDGSYDYKDRTPNNTNIVPSWHAYNSFSLTQSFVSDDFFGMMDDNEGDMSITDKLDIAVGRMLVETPQRAREMVDKVETYHQNISYGNWRNNFIAISDDVDEDWERVLQETTDEIGNLVTQNKPFINVIKIHSDAFQQESSSSGERYPQVNKAIRDAIDVGALVVNYFGHGGEDGLSAERIFDRNDSQQVQNTCKYNCFVTVTCEYTKFDNPSRPTAGEFTYWNTKGGAIALITTTRQIFVTVGVDFNKKLEEHLFSFGTNDYVSAAEALRLTKIEPAISGNPQNRLVFFIGDPALKLAFPKPDIKLTAVNDVLINQVSEPLKSLSHVKLAGEVQDEVGNLVSNYNGILSAIVFDKNIERQTLANDGTTLSGQIIKLDFETLGEAIFRGQATITNGRFEFDFIVPRDINIPIGNGKVSFYAKNENPLQDQAGANFDIQIGGINENAEEDNIGPTIALFMNDENFVSGGITNEAPTFLAKLQDDNGINTASGIGHDIVAIIDGDETNPFILNDYYQSNVDDYQNGTVTYPFRDLEPGLHTVSLKAWDVYNNSSISEIQFMVHDKDEELVINNVLNYPNPFVNYTEFWFNHNSSEPLDVSIQVFTISGKLVRTLNGQTGAGECCNKGASNLSRSIVWDGRDDFGDKIGKGVYVYKLKVKSNLLNKQIEKIQKLVIL